jgi:hypothetical protein
VSAIFPEPDWESQRAGFLMVTNHLRHLPKGPRNAFGGDDDPPASTAELAARWLARWRSGDDSEKAICIEESLSFTDDMKAAVRRLSVARKAES